MGDFGAQLNQLSPEQRQAIMMNAQQEANQQVMHEMVKQMTSACFEKCAGTSVRYLALELLRWSGCSEYASGRRCGGCAVSTNVCPIVAAVPSSQGDKLDGREQSCLAMCQDRYLETRAHVQEALQKRQL